MRVREYALNSKQLQKKKKIILFYNNKISHCMYKYKFSDIIIINMTRTKKNAINRFFFLRIIIIIIVIILFLILN